MAMNLNTIDKLLTTTRSVRRRLDFERPVEAAVIRGCLEIAIQAPTGGNSQGWRFMIVSDPQKKARIGELYHESFLIYARAREEQSAAAGDRPQRDQEQRLRVAKSAVYLAKRMGKVPLMIIPCIAGRVEERDVMAQASLYGSILPATWSLMLALRARGLGSAYTTLHLRYEKEIAALLDIPGSFTQAALLPVAYFSGEDFKPAKRIPAAELTYWNTWENS
jgi:nitroreductase